MRTDLYRDPKVCVMADLLMSEDGDLARYVSQNMQRDITVTRNVMRNVTVGALVSVWGVLRHRGKRVGSDLLVKGCTLSVIDDVADLPGFGETMASVGWAEITEDGVVFPRFFDEFNIDPAEDSKKKNAERQRRFREKQKAESNVTECVTLTSESNVREEKRRDKKHIPAKPAGFCFKTELLNLGVSPDLVRDWMAVRKSKKATNTQTAFDSFLRNVEKAGWTVAAAVTHCVEKDWKGFDAEWVKDIRTASDPVSLVPRIDTSLESRRAGLQAQADAQYRERKWLDGERRYRAVITIENGQLVRTKHYEDQGAAA